MNEPLVPMSKLGAYALWTMTVGLMLVGWAVYLGHLADMGLMIVTSACVTGLGATTLTVRCYVRHLSRLVRWAGGLPMPEAQARGLRSVAD